jgi:hypothetical protein
LIIEVNSFRLIESCIGAMLLSIQQAWTTQETGDTIMFGYSHIVRYARLWRAKHQRALMERTMLDLPVELQKDIGWPAPRDLPSGTARQQDLHARPAHLQP